MVNGSPINMCPRFGTCFPHCGKRVPYKYVHPFLDTGAHIYRGPVFHHLFTTLAPVFCFETVYTHTQTSGNVLSKSGVRLALAAPV